ncbi:MAG: hypothetical protein SFU27_06975 [Thermonemataceae bacterium]|nr:hypothetical protein [Thermonemataceae bacterium]
MKKLQLSFAIFLLFLGFSACKKTSEGEQTKWKSTQMQAETLKKDFPAFASVIDTKMKEATSKWEAAQKVSNEEEKIKALAEVNSSFNTGFFHDLGFVKMKKESVEKKLKELSGKKVKKAALSQVNNAIKDADAVLVEVNSLMNSSVSSVSDADTKAKDAQSKLTNVETKLKNAIKKAK